MGARTVACGLVSLVVACGGRSSLLALGEGERAGEGGEGGALAGGGGGPDGSGGDGASSSSGGTGEAPVVPACSALSLAWGPVFVDTPGLSYISSVQLTPVGGGAVALTATGLPGNGFEVLDHGRVEPWGEGEPEVAPLKKVAGPMSNLAFVAPGDEDGRYALFYQPGFPFGPLTVVPALDPGSAYGPYPAGIEFPLAPATQMAIAAWPSGGHLVLFRALVSPVDTVLAAGIVDGAVGPLEASTSGCGPTWATADAVTLDDDEGVVATVSVAEAGACPQIGASNAQLRLQTGTVDRSTATITIEEDRELDEQRTVFLTPRSDGAWLLTEPTAGMSPPVTIQRLDRRGRRVGEPIDVLPASPYADRQAAWGDGLAVAAENPNDGTGATAGLWLVDADGTLVDVAQVEAPARLNGPVAVAVSPALDAFLIAFPSTLPDVPIGLLRFDCVP